MAILPIVTYNDPVLRQKAKPVKEDSEELQELITSMFETMYNANGVGLAAPQVGKTIRLFVMDVDIMTAETDSTDLGPLALINPDIVEKSDEIVKMEEGCLSIPEVRDEIARSEHIVVSYLDRFFETRQMECSGWVSRVIQHEYDHLQGTLFLDHLSAFRRRLHRSKLNKIESGLFETDYPLLPKTKKKKS